VAGLPANITAEAEAQVKSLDKVSFPSVMAKGWAARSTSVGKMLEPHSLH
jgi:hypothetical protein